MWYVVGGDRTTNRREPSSPQCPFERFTKTARFVDRWRQRGVESWWKCARYGLLIGFDHVGMINEYGTCRGIEQGKRAGQYVVLELWIRGPSEWATERELAVQGARWRHLHRHFTHR